MTAEQWEHELQQSLKEARAEVALLRRAHRGNTTASTKQAIEEAHARSERLLLELNIVRATGERYGVYVEDDLLQGILAVDLEPGTSQQHRHAVVVEAVNQALTARADELGLILTASPDRFARPPRRDPSVDVPKTQGSRLLVEVTGRIEGDYLVPAISRKSKRRGRR